MSAPEIPLGQRESERLEFKDRAVLDDPRKVAREVVAFLNADGGEVWIGLGEEEGRAVRVQAIPRISAGEVRLRDTLTDVIEPAPARGEVGIETVPVEGGEILRVVVERGQRGPYALLHRGRDYVVRFADRIRPMTREELAAAFRQESESTATIEIPRAISERQAELQREGEPRFWVRAQPSRDLDLDLSSAKVDALLQDPRESGNRRDGWTVLEPYQRPQPIQGGRRSGDDRGKTTLLRRSGAIDFTLPLERLRHGKERELWPPKLLEYPVSLFRLAARLWQPDLAADAAVYADLALLAVRGWSLRPYAPGTLDFRLEEPREWPGATDLVLERPLTFSFSEVRDEPDRCGARLVERVYEAFGYERNQMPHVFDWDSGRLEIPA